MSVKPKVQRFTESVLSKLIKDTGFLEIEEKSIL